MDRIYDVRHLATRAPRRGSSFPPSSTRPAVAGADHSNGEDMTALAAKDFGSARILLIVPEDSTRQLIDSLLQLQGYDVIALPDEGDALDVLRDQRVDLVAVGAGADEVLATIRSRRRYADVPILMVGRDAAGADSPRVPLGADDVVLAPIVPVDLFDRIGAALRLRRSLLGMTSAHQVVAALASELIAPDGEMRLHTERIGTYAAELGRRAGLSAADLHAVAYATLLHDMAKLGIGTLILSKTGPLTEDETTAMRRHTEIGERIAARLPGWDRFGPILRHHHERWDGGGYPDGLAARAIPLGARIIGIVDSFDAMTQFRAHRPPMSVPDAVEEMCREGGKQFDPELVDEFVAVLQWDGLV